MRVMPTLPESRTYDCTMLNSGPFPSTVLDLIIANGFDLKLLTANVMKLKFSDDNVKSCTDLVTMLRPFCTSARGTSISLTDLIMFHHKSTDYFPK